MLEAYAFPKLQGNLDLIFQQDGAPPHWGLRVRGRLDAQFPNKWIGRGGPIAWPARSPDITPCDFSLWGFVKHRVFQTPVNCLLELKQRITDVVNQVNQNMLLNTWRELHRRLKWLKEHEGKHYDVYK